MSLLTDERRSVASPEEPTHAVPDTTFVVKTRLRHLAAVQIHNLTLTPHRDEFLSRNQDGLVNSPDLKERGTVDDLELASSSTTSADGVLKWPGGNRRRRLSSASVRSQLSTKATDSPPSPTIPLLSPTLDRPSPFVRPSAARSRSLHPPSALNKASNGSTVPGGSRSRASSRSSVTSNGSDVTLKLPPVGRELLGIDTIAEFMELSKGGSPTSSSAIGFILDQANDNSSILEVEEGKGKGKEIDWFGGLAAKELKWDEFFQQKLIKSFITIRMKDDKWSELYRQPFDGATTSHSPSSSSTISRVSPALSTSSSTRVSTPNGHPPNTPPTSTHGTPFSSKTTRTRQPPRSAFEVTSPSSLDLPVPLAPGMSRSSSHSTSTTSPSPKMSRISATSSSTLSRSASFSSPSDNTTTKLNRSPHRPRSISSSQSNKHLSPLNHAKANIKSKPTPAPLDPNNINTPFYISQICAPSSNPHYGAITPSGKATSFNIDQVSGGSDDYAQWAWENKVGSEEDFILDVWVLVDTTSQKLPETEPTPSQSPQQPDHANPFRWQRLRQIEVDMKNLKIWDGKSTLPPNTPLFEFAHPQNSRDLMYLPPITRPSLQRSRSYSGNRSDSNIETVSTIPTMVSNTRDRLIQSTSSDISTSGRATAASRRVASLALNHMSALQGAMERSLRETRMQKGMSLGQFIELSKLEEDLIKAREEVEELKEGLRGDWVEIDVDGGDSLRRDLSQRQEKIKWLEGQAAAIKDRRCLALERISHRKALLAKRRNHLQLVIKSAVDEETRLSDIRLQTEQQRFECQELQPHYKDVRARLSTDLESIFPITPLDGPSLLFSIVNVPLPIPTSSKSPAPPLHLPASALPHGIKLDEETIAAALGYTAMVVKQVSGWLDCVLPYPITCIQSRSVIKDPISMIQGPRVFPLYTKGMEKYRFEYAVFLLNKNIEMLMIDQNIRIMDFRQTLPNIKNLLLTLSSSSGSTSKTPAAFLFKSPAALVSMSSLSSSIAAVDDSVDLSDSGSVVSNDDRMEESETVDRLEDDGGGITPRAENSDALAAAGEEVSTPSPRPQVKRSFWGSTIGSFTSSGDTAKEKKGVLSTGATITATSSSQLSLPDDKPLSSPTLTVPPLHHGSGSRSRVARALVGSGERTASRETVDGRKKRNRSGTVTAPAQKVHHQQDHPPSDVVV